MKEIFEQLITDFHGGEIPKPSKRDFVMPDLPHNVRKSFVFVGIRRSGKTWAMYQCMHALYRRGISKQKVVYINFEDDRLISMQPDDFQSILDAYFSLYPQYIDNKDLHFFFDEIHEVEGWEKFVRRLLDRESISLYLSGSSAKMLSKEIASSLRGRTMIQEIFPFSFKEFLEFHKVRFQGRLTSKQKSEISYYAKDFLMYGGFPEAVSMDRGFHRNLLQGYIDVVIYRDIIERHNVANVHIVRELLTFCIQNAASPVSMNKIYQRFKSLGKKVGKNSLYEFMDYFEDAYCVFTVPIYSHSLNKQNANPRKIYVVDQGLITAYTIKPAFEEAGRLENTVFCKLRRMTEEVFYYKTRSGKEIDFLVVLPDGVKKLYQVCVSLSDPNTRKRELDAVCQAMEELSFDTATIVTAGNDEKINCKQGVVRCISLWKWLLSE